MKTYRRILKIVLAGIAMVGCKNESGKSKKEQSVVEKTSTAENSIQKEQQTSFHKTLTLQNISFEIKSSG